MPFSDDKLLAKISNRKSSWKEKKKEKNPVKLVAN